MVIVLYFTLQVIAEVILQFTQAQESRKGKELILDIADEHKSQYLSQDFDTS